MPDARPDPDATWQPIAPGVWSLTHPFSNMGLRVSTRMTAVQLGDGSVFAHSAVPLNAAQLAQLNALGTLRWVVAPNAMHHLFLGHLLAQQPQAQVFGPPSLRAKRPDLPLLDWPEDGTAPHAPWGDALVQQRFGGIPLLDEASWFHRPTGTLLLGDVCQCWQGPLSLPVRTYLGLTGGHERLTVPRTVRLITRDRAAARASAQALLALPIARIVLLHNSVLTQDAHTALARAFAIWD